MVSNFLPPDSQPWVRALENKVKALETSITSLKRATTSRVSSAITTPGGVLTLGGEKVPGEGVLNGSLEHLNGVYTLRYSHEFHGLTQYVLIVSGKASGVGELSLLGPEGQVLDSDTLETDVYDENGFYFAVNFPILTMNYEFEPEDEDGGGPDTDQEVVASYVLPDTGTLSLVTGATLSEFSYEIRSASSSQVTIDTSSGVPTITGVSADGTTIDAMHDYSDTLEFLENALEEAQRELADARAEAEQNFGTLDDKLGAAFPDSIFDVNLAIEQAKDLAEQQFNDSVTGTVVEYARNSDETDPPVTGWSTTAPARTPGTFIWMRTTVSYGSGESSTTNPVLLTGNAGSTGAQGVSVESITPHFRRLAESATKPAKPTGMTQSGWVEVEPDYARDTTMWRSDRIVFSNGQIAWTDVSKSSSYEAAKAAEAAALAYADEKKQEAIDAGAHDLANLQIGGRNYMLNSAKPGSPFVIASNDNVASPLQQGTDEIGQWITGTDAATGEFYISTHTGPTFNGGRGSVFSEAFFPVPEVYSQSVEVMSEVAMPVRLGGAGADTLIQPNEWTKISGTFSHGTRLVGITVPNNPDVPDGTKLYIRNWKLERGTKATDWTPAPEDVDAGIDAAMSMASGKNSASYTDVADSVAEPGPAPTQAMGLGRRQFDMHRNRRSDGQIIGEWIWTGTAWSRLTLSDAMLSSLDVGKLTAGTANIETAVVDKMWGQLGVFDKLDVRTDAYISGVNLKDGAVTARTLNVVPEDGQGGTVLTGTTIGMVNSDGTGMMDLSVGSDNYLSFYRDEVVNFSVSADGSLSSQDVSANENLYYRGTELTELLETMPRGVVYYAEPINGIYTISNASYTSRIGHIVVERPSTPRHWRIVARAGVQSSTSGGTDTSGVHWRFVSNAGRQYDEASWKALSSVLYQTSGYYWQTETFEHVVNTDDISWNSAGQALVSWTARNSIGHSYKLGQGAIFYIEDVGPAFDRSPTYPWIRPSGSRDSGSSTTPTSQTGTWNMSSFQNYLSGVKYSHTSGNLAGGNYSGEWRGLMFFPHATIRSALSGATISKVEVYLQNAHTYAYSGSTILIGSHNYASAPASRPAVAARTSQHFSRGQGRWVTLPNAVGDGFKGGTIKGLAVYGGSTANYATWVPSAPKLRITYKK